MDLNAIRRGIAVKSLILSSCILGVLAISTANAEIIENSEGVSSEDVCANLERMLLEVQVRVRDFADAQYREMNSNLRRAHRNYCESAKEVFAVPDLVKKLSPSDQLHTAEQAKLRPLRYPNGMRVFDLGQWRLPDGTSMRIGNINIQFGLPPEFAGQTGPILNPYLAKHRQCASGCSYVSWGIWGDAAHQRRASCHNSGEAIDIHAITCGGRTYGPTTQRFRQYVQCMRGKFYVIFGSGDHANHAHIQFQGCRKVSGSQQGNWHGSSSNQGGTANQGGREEDDDDQGSSGTRRPGTRNGRNQDDDDDQGSSGTRRPGTRNGRNQDDDDDGGDSRLGRRNSDDDKEDRDQGRNRDESEEDDDRSARAHGDRDDDENVKDRDSEDEDERENDASDDKSDERGSEGGEDERD